MLDLSRVFLYRMTHIQNIPHILQHGITHIRSSKRNIDYVPIGDGSLIAARNKFPLNNGKTLGDYIPFYFGPRMPMLYVMQNGFNGVNPVHPRDIVYCVTSIGVIEEQKLSYIFSDGHAVDGFSTFYNSDDVKRIEEIIDWEAVKRKYWKDENDLDLKRRKEAEFLVEGDMPPATLIGFVAHSKESAEIIKKMQNFGNQKIVIQTNYYF